MTTRRFFAAVAAMIFVCSAMASAESAVEAVGRAESYRRFNPLFPRALTMAGFSELNAAGSAGYSDVPSYRDYLLSRNESPRLQSVLLNNDVFALYGKPGSRGMGILGQYSLEGIEPVMNEFVKTYDAANGDRGIVPAFYIIFGTCWPEGEIGYLSDSVIRKYIDYAAERGWIVFLDHQIGKYTVEASVKRLLPYLAYPNVHLALDPEWRTTKPMKEIGSVTAEEVNAAERMIQEYMEANNLPGRRMLVVHQFKPKMIMNRSAVRTDFELVQLIHCADGFGSPTLKKSTYAQNAEAKNIPLKSFKLFLKPTVAGAGYDVPLMTPEDVYLLNPRPYLIMYQ